MYAFRDMSIKASTSTSNTQLVPQDHQGRKKLNDLVTTGFPVSVTARVRKGAGVQMQFGLMLSPSVLSLANSTQFQVPIPASHRRSVPTLIHNKDATAFIDLC